MNQDNGSLEDFFRKGLSEKNDFLMEDSGWDMPSDSVWEGIEAALPATKRSIPFFPIISIAPMRRWKWASAASVLLLVFTYATFNSQQEIENLQQQVAIQSDQLKDLQENNNNSISGFPIIGNEASIGDKVDAFLAKAKESVGTKENNIAFAKNNKINSPASAGSYTESESITPITLSFTPIKNNDTGFISSSELPLFSNNKTTVRLNSLSDLPLSLASMDLHPNELATLSDLKDLPIKEHSMIEPVMLQCVTPKSRFYAGLFTGPSRWKTKTDSKIDDAVIVEGKINKESGMEMGGKVGWQINNNWSLETGVSLAKNNRTLDHQVSFAFDPERERPNADGTLQSTYDSKINTSFGNVAVSLDVNRSPEHTLLPGQDFDVNYNNEITTTLIQVPLVARYGIQRGKLNVSLSAGMLLSFLQDQYIKLPENTTGNHPQMLIEHPRLKGKGSEMNKMHYAMQGGVQVAYRPNTTIEFYLAPTYTQGLTPVAESEEATTTLAQAGLMAGVNVRF